MIFEEGLGAGELVERLEREAGLDLVTTIPNVEYRVTLTNDQTVSVENPSKMPERGVIETVEEPYVRIHMVTPSDYIGGIQALCHDRRGEYVGLHYLDSNRVEIRYDIPLAEIVLDFYDRLKTISRGYAALDYEMAGFRLSDLVKLDILLNGDPVDALSVIVHRDRAYDYGRKVARKLRELIPRQMFEVAIQAAIGAGAEATFEDGHGERVLQAALDGALERASAVIRIVTDLRQVLPCRFAYLQGEASSSHTMGDLAQLDIHNARQVFACKRVEDDDLVYAVEKFGPEVGLQDRIDIVSADFSLEQFSIGSANNLCITLHT